MKREKPAQQKSPAPKRRESHPEAKGLILLALSLLSLFCLLSFSAGNHRADWLGIIGYCFAFGVNYLFGLTSYLIICFLGWVGWQYLCARPIPFLGLKIFYFSTFLVSCAILLNLLAETGAPFLSIFKNKVFTETILIDLPYHQKHIRYNLGGVPLYYFYRDLPTFNLQRMLSDVGCFLTFSITAIVSFVLLTKANLQPVIQWMVTQVTQLREKLGSLQVREKIEAAPQVKEEEEWHEELTNSLSRPYPQPFYDPHHKLQAKTQQEPMPLPPFELKEPKINTYAELPKREERPKPAPAPQRAYQGDFTKYKLPPPSLLNNPKKVDQPTLKKDLRRQAEILEETLLSFGIEAKVGEINCGPTITSFEVHPAIGVKVQKITALENDIALNLQAKSMRIIAPIPGKAAVGVEIPSLYPQEVSLKEMLLSYQQASRKCLIPVLLGKTVSGENVITDLAKMPHCIIAGATGSGKSVCINTVILSILMTARPDEIKLLMIDPKKVELTAYSELPHMIAPVITEPHGAYAALNWLVKEMQTRYDILKQLGLRNISAFNARDIDQELESSLNIPIPTHMPAIVAIIDEFADLMMVSSSDLETPVARIAQMARAVGIHLILATQRPSREVITGLIKANFPTRIAFKVASRVNSQIILDETGAENLLGNGDMLFLPPGSSHLVRAQGAFVSDEEINRIISFISSQAPTNYLIPSFDTMRREDIPLGQEMGEDEGTRDMLYEQALSIVIETNTASTTFLQRKLKIGYARAASLMDELEAKGVISPQEGSKPRRVLKNSDAD